jgi:alpha-amylase/alpha-mannosidase (GH57 family)
MTRYLCIHSHFYQPPRENPWLESIEMQDSAYPYHDWNERIDAECYAPNTAARILDGKDRIVRIVNNYKSMSFNVGPTLLSWMEAHAPETYAQVLEADRDSRKRFSGHGNAIAQVYNHMIMPLANRRDKETQILWGLADFVHRFGHKPEGMWLAETAVDLESLDLMAKHGIQFTILSPYQAKRVRRAGTERWLDASGGLVDPQRAYRVALKEGRSIAVFFYDGGVSQAVAFERLLENGERFANRLTQAFSPSKQEPQLVHIATDGETYGHHHKHGEMALAYAVEHIERNKLARLTNYGEFLELHPPQHEAEIIENSAWSCSHGVGRWNRDCGCSSGSHWGWNQQWRGPLREAYDYLRDAIAPEFEKLGKKLLEDPWDARNRYIGVMLDRSQESREDFLASGSLGKLDAAQQTQLWKLLEMQRHAMLMYTSCGWFFDDLSGIETVQTMQYAGRALQLFEELAGPSATAVSAQFTSLLAKAQSNVRDFGSGEAIYNSQVVTSRVDLPKLAAHYAISSLFADYETRAKVYCFACDSLERRDSKAGRLRAATGRVKLRSEITGEQDEYAYGVVHFGDHNITGAVTLLSNEAWYQKAQAGVHRAFGSADIPALIRMLDREWGGADAYTLRSLFRDEQRSILRSVLQESLEESEGAFRRLYEQNLPLMRFLTALGTPQPRVFESTAATAVNTLLKRALSAQAPEVSKISALLEEARAARVELDSTTLEYQLRNRIDTAAKAFVAHPKSLESLDQFLSWVRAGLLMPFRVHPWAAQNRCYAVLRSHYSRQVKRSAEGDRGAALWVERFRELAVGLAVFIPDH